MKRHKSLLAFLASLSLLLPPPVVQASEINIDLESSGRLEYNIDDAGNPDILITINDLQKLSTTVTEYETNVRKKWLEAFQYNGINFDNDFNAKLQDSGKDWSEMTIHKLSEGLKHLPQSWCKNVNSKHTQLSINTQESSADAVSPLSITGSVEYKLNIPKGWREREAIIDLTDIYREAMAAWSDSGFQDEHAKKVYHIHSAAQTNDTHEHAYNYVCNSYASDTSTNTTIGGCYTIPIKHHHYGSDSSGGGCYTKYIRHDHVGGTGASQGGANTCYTTALYHKHSTSSTTDQSTSQNAGTTSSQSKSGGCFTQNNSYWQNKGNYCKWENDGTEVGDKDDPDHSYKDWKKCKYCGDRQWCNAANCHESSCKIHNGGKNCSGKRIIKYDLNCGKDQTSVENWRLSCTLTPGPQVYNFYQSNLRALGLGDSYQGTDCPHYEGKIMKYACTRSYNCTELETMGSGNGCGKVAHQLLSMTVTF